MGKIVFAELLDRRGNIRERSRVDSFPATIGRGYTNAIVVDDRFVNAEHLRLSLDDQGVVVVEDLDTANGTYLDKSRRRAERERIPPGGEIVLTIGNTVIRLRGDDFAVGPAVLSKASSGPFGRYIGSRAASLLGFAAGFALSVFTMAQTITKKVIWSDLAGMSLFLLFAFVLWSGFWSFLNRLVAHSFRFMTHLGIAGAGSVLFLLFFVANEYFEFLLSAPAAAKAAGFAGFAGLFALLLYGHLSVISASSPRKRLLSSALISATVVGIALLIAFAKEKEFSNELNFSAVMKPIGHQWVRTVSSNEFFGGLDKLRAKIDTLIREESKEKEAK